MCIHNNNTKNLNKKISLPSNSNPNQSLYLRKITASEICNIIVGMRHDSTPGKDGISINVIKQNKETISNILEHIFITLSKKVTCQIRSNVPL